MTWNSFKEHVEAALKAQNATGDIEIDYIDISSPAESKELGVDGGKYKELNVVVSGGDLTINN